MESMKYSFSSNSSIASTESESSFDSSKSSTSRQKLLNQMVHDLKLDNIDSKESISTHPAQPASKSKPLNIPIRKTNSYVLNEEVKGRENSRQKIDLLKDVKLTNGISKSNMSKSLERDRIRENILKEMNDMPSTSRVNYTKSSKRSKERIREEILKDLNMDRENSGTIISNKSKMSNSRHGSNINTYGKPSPPPSPSGSSGRSESGAELNCYNKKDRSTRHRTLSMVSSSFFDKFGRSSFSSISSCSSTSSTKSDISVKQHKQKCCPTGTKSENNSSVHDIMSSFSEKVERRKQMNFEERSRLNIMKWKTKLFHTSNKNKNIRNYMNENNNEKQAISTNNQVTHNHRRDLIMENILEMFPEQDDDIDIDYQIQLDDMDVTTDGAILEYGRFVTFREKANPSSKESKRMKEYLGSIAYIGQTQFDKGEWIGISLLDPVGNNNGTVEKVKYFECEENHGIFVPMNKVI